MMGLMHPQNNAIIHGHDRGRKTMPTPPSHQLNLIW